MRAAFAALDTRLAAFVPSMPIAWPNRDYEPTLGTAWLRVSHLPAATTRRSIGADGKDVHQGIFQVVVNFPTGAGPGGAETRADAVAAHFPTGATYSGVRIAGASVAPGFHDGGWYRIPVSIDYEYIP